MVWQPGLIFIILLATLNTTFANVLKVGEGREFITLSSALEASVDGDTVVVFEGRYKEAPLEVNNSITLIGHNWPVIDGEHQYEVLKITADSVDVSGFRIVGSGVSHTRDNAAIRFYNVNGGSINNNELDSNYFGIYLGRANGITIRNNFITTYAEREAKSANGIHLWNSKNAEIHNNRIEGHRDGIYLEYVENSAITNNTTNNNLRYGLHFMFSDSCLYDNNRFRQNGAGVAVMYSSQVKMTNNLFADNWGTSSYGLLLKDINDSHIEGNIFTTNTIGIRADQCNRTEIRRNVFRDNGWAVRILSNSMDNLFTENNFINNTFDVSTNSRQNHSTFEANYWNKYSGYDLTGDGAGDVPYRPVRLFSLIVEQNPTALMLLRSFFIDLLDMAERIIPVLTPETLVDEKPQMKPYDI